MEVEEIPAALRHKLGEDATAALLAVLDRAGSDWRNDVIALSTERFERRLAEEGAALRVAVAHSESAVRKEIGALDKNVHADLAAIRVDLFKWSFLFWIGQVVAVTGIMSVMLRIGGP